MPALPIRRDEAAAKIQSLAPAAMSAHHKQTSCKSKRSSATTNPMDTITISPQYLHKFHQEAYRRPFHNVIFPWPANRLRFAKKVCNLLAMALCICRRELPIWDGGDLIDSNTEISSFHQLQIQMETFHIQALDQNLMYRMIFGSINSNSNNSYINPVRIHRIPIIFDWLTHIECEICICTVFVYKLEILIIFVSVQPVWLVKDFLS